MNTQKLEQVPIDKLVPYDRNARTLAKNRSHSSELLSGSSAL